MPASCWHLCQPCAGIVSLIAWASLRNIVVVAALLTYRASSSLTALADVIVCGGHLWRCAGIISLMALASLSPLRWRHHPCQAGVCLLVTLSSHAALLLCWCRCCMQSHCRTRRSQPRHLMQRCCHAGFAVVWGIVAIHGIVVVVCGSQ